MSGANLFCRKIVGQTCDDYGGGGMDARIGPQPAVWAQRLSSESND